MRVASFPSASATLLTEAVSDFRGRHPKVRLSVAEAEPEESLPALRAGELDLAITFDYPGSRSPDDRDIEHTLLLTEAMYVALPEDHPLAEPRQGRHGGPGRRAWLSGGCPSSCGSIVSPRAATRASSRGSRSSPTTTTCFRLHRRRPRGHAAARPRPAHAAHGRRRPADRPPGADAPGLGRDARDALSGDGRDAQGASSKPASASHARDGEARSRRLAPSRFAPRARRGTQPGTASPVALVFGAVGREHRRLLVEADEGGECAAPTTRRRSRSARLPNRSA